MIKIRKLKIFKSSQEQAVASWINYLNEIRLEDLIKELNEKQAHLEDALNEIGKARNMIQHSIIERNRGGYKGMHGFIAEVAECGVGNAKEIIQGRAPNIFG